MKEPLLSVVIPTFQRCSYLRKALESLNQPGCQRVTAVVSDNCSTDGTSEMLADLDVPFEVFHQRHPENIGICRNLYAAAKAVKTPYQVWMTDDDFFMQGALEKMLAAIDEHPNVGYFFSHVHSISDGEPEDAKPLHVIGPSRTDVMISPGISAVVEFARYGWAYSRQVHKTEWIDFDLWERNLMNSYSPIIISARMLLEYPCFYQAESLVAHLVGNPRHWEEFGSDNFEIRLRVRADHRDAVSAALDHLVDAGDPEAMLAVKRWERASREEFIEVLKPVIRESGFGELVEVLQSGLRTSWWDAVRVALRCRLSWLHQSCRRLHRHTRENVAEYVDLVGEERHKSY